MEGTACYRYVQIARYLRDTGRPAVRTVVDIGANVGDITRAMLAAFPEANILAFEVVPSLVVQLRARFANHPRVEIRHAAVDASPGTLCIWEGLPASGDGWRGGSVVRPQGIKLDTRRYKLIGEVSVVSLDALVADIGPVDYIKSDCEGSEANFLGAASADTLSAIRWIGGEYHQLARWWPVQQRLASTYRCNLIADAKHAKQLGSFFLERSDESPGLLSPEPIKPLVYPWGLPEPIWWHGCRKGYQ